MTSRSTIPATITIIGRVSTTLIFTYKRRLAERAVYWALRDVYGLYPKAKKTCIQAVTFADDKAVVTFVGLQLNNGTWMPTDQFQLGSNNQKEIGGLLIDEKTEWDNPVFVQYRKGLDKVGKVTRILHDLNEQFFKGDPEIITAGLVAYDTINKAWLKKVDGCIVDQELTLQLLHGSHPKEKDATNWLQYVDGIGMHIYPATVALSPDTAFAEIPADLDPCRTVPGVGRTKPFWITERGNPGGL